MSPYDTRHGLKTGLIVGVVLWTVLFLPLATFGIQPMIDVFNRTVSPNQYVYSIASSFNGLYCIIVIGSLIFHLVYGALLGFMAGRMVEIGHLTLSNRIDSLTYFI